MAQPAADPVKVQTLRRVGVVLCDRYRLVRLLGVGGMGAVYAGVHHRNGHAVAVKVLHEALSADRECRRLFRREALLANRVGHAGAVPVLDEDVDTDGSPFLVLPLLVGETLRGRWERCSRRMPIAEVVLVADRVLDVLRAAHRANVVHRDIKPENVLVTRSGEIRVLDFGVARLLQAERYATTWSGGMVGTPAFMPPELALGRSREMDGRTDLWAVGALMYSLLTGRFVHEAESSVEVLVKAATRSVSSIAEACPQVPVAVRAVIERALAFEREARWPDAVAMQRALADAWRESTGTDVSSLPPVAAPDNDPCDSLHERTTLRRSRAVVALSAESSPRAPIPGAAVTPTAGGAAASRVSVFARHALEAALPVYSSGELVVSIGRPAPWVFLSRVQGHLDVGGARVIGDAVRSQTAAEKRLMIICHDWSQMTDYDGTARVLLTDVARAVLPYSAAIHVFATSQRVTFGVRAASLVVGKITAHVKLPTFAAAIVTAVDPTSARQR